MSRHGGKRLSVFDRLGPGNDDEITPPHSSSSSRHSRHYSSSEKHERSSSHLPPLSTEERSRDKRTSDPPPRKHRHPDDEDSTKREKATPTLRKDIKLSKPSRGSGRDHELADELTHSKRKREATSDNETHHREPKRQKISDSSLERHHQLHKSEKKEAEGQSRSKESSAGSSKKRLTTSESQNDPDPELDWDLLSKFPNYKASSLKMNSLERHKAGSVLSFIGVSPSLAGPVLADQAVRTVTEHLKKEHGDSIQAETLSDPFGGHQTAALGAANLRRTLKSSQSFDIGYCRRALTARADFMLRKRFLGNKYSNKNDEFRAGFSHYYSASLRLYQQS
ncbi:PREDICTED: uncharacterized protein LOC105316537 [Amphimedon queenslandica]|uniref:Uncharacterized protein n=1 Tax=Amphimedon queenslandica TaxID=400682 RepID=A0A1X7VNN2_AMPQE|nr:PREDICTED: uncharacterized protein LOC105316537 [Amphimedon queenslandica]|eukprot:XP_011409796.1 PREDICTED: uncharacterized protein LOC105316537 [Amphimedon queenslandica]